MVQVQQSILVFFIIIFCVVPCGRLSWLCQLLGARKYSASYRIVSYRIPGCLRVRRITFALNEHGARLLNI